MTRPVRRLALAAAAATLAPLGALPGSTAAPVPAAQVAETAADPARPHLSAPGTVAAALRGDSTVARVPLEVDFVAGTTPVELWSTRSSYAQEIRTVVRTAAGETLLPVGSMSTFDRLDRLVRVTVTARSTGEVVQTAHHGGCIGADAHRARPDAPPRSPYTGYCFANPYALGTVHGVQAGWSSRILDYGAALRLPRGRYRVEVALRPVVARALGVAPADAVRTIRATVTRATHDHDDHDHGGEPEPGHAHRDGGSALQPAGTTGPTGRRLDAGAAVEGPVPNLRSVPAWGIDVSRNGDFLRFSATVWNAGDSPLVVDGFATEDQDRMDAYQYFFDTDGEQTGYQRVGSFDFDHKPTHQHWHFRDFARYTLLRADKTTAVHSRKEAFCLANTDAVDLTVPGADWTPGNTDLATDCGWEDSRSLRQVLAAGWGDTYAQYRAGQSFDLRGLPNGVYHVATIANPRGRLVESSTTDNVALRRVVIGGRPGARTVRVPQVGLVEEHSYGW